MAVKSLFSRLRRSAAPADADELLAASSLLPLDELTPVVWTQRAADLDAKPLAPAAAASELLALWRDEAALAALGESAAARLASTLVGAEIGSGRELLRQDEQGNFLLILLAGRALLERRQAGGGSTRLAECRPGDLIGELAVLDAGPRFAACRTLAECRVAVLDAAALQGLMRDDAPLAAALLAAIARRLSLRLRLTSARLNALLVPQ